MNTLYLHLFLYVSNNVLVSQQWSYWAKRQYPFLWHLESIVQCFSSITLPYISPTPVHFTVYNGHRHSGGGWVQKDWVGTLEI